MLSLAQNMIRLGPAQLGRFSAPLFAGAAGSIGIALWYRRTTIENQVTNCFVERTLGVGGTPHNSNVSAWIELGASGDPTPFNGRFGASDASGVFQLVQSPLTVPDDRLVLIVAWRTPTGLGVSVDGEAPVTLAFTAPDPPIDATYAMLGGRDGGTGTYAPHVSRYATGDYFSLGAYTGNVAADPPFSSADIAALKAAGPVAYADLPALASGTLKHYFEPDSYATPDRVGGAKSVRFIRAIEFVAPPVARSSGVPAFDGTRAGTFGEGPGAFSFAPAASPIFREPPRRVELTATTKGVRSHLAMAGRPNWLVGLALSLRDAMAEPGAAGTDGLLLSEPAGDGSSVDLLMVGGRLPSVRFRDALGATLHQVTAAESPFRDVEILAVSSQEVTTDHGSHLRTRLDMTVAAGHDVIGRTHVRLTDAGWSGADYTVSHVSDDDTIISVVRDGHGHPLPAVGSFLYGAGTGAGAGSSSSSASGEIALPRLLGLAFERDGVTVNIYARGKLIGTGTVPIGVLGKAAGAESWLGGAPGDGDAFACDLLGVVSGYGLSAAKKAELHGKITTLVEGRDGFADDAAFIVSTENSYLSDAVGPLDYPAEWHVRNPDGTDHDPRLAWSGQSYSRHAGHWPGMAIGDEELAGPVDHPTSLTIWPRRVLRSGALNPDRHAGTPYRQEITIRRRPIGALGRTIYCSTSDAFRDDDPDNEGTGPARPLATASAAIARAGPFDTILLKRGDTFAGVSMNQGGRAPGRVRVAAYGEGAAPIIDGKFSMGGDVRNAYAHFRAVIPAGTNTNAFDVTGAGGGSGFSGTLLKDLEGFITGYGTAFGGGAMGRFNLFLDCRPRNSAPGVTSEPYGFFLNSANNIAFVGCDTFIRSGGGSNPLRQMGVTHMTWSHQPEPPAGFADGSKYDFSLRANAHNVLLADWAPMPGVRRDIELLTAPPWLYGRGNFMVERVAGIYEINVWKSNGSVISHSRTGNALSAGSDSPGQSNHRSSRLRAYGVQRSGSTAEPWPEVTESRFSTTTGPWRWQGTGSEDLGPHECPDIGSAVAVAGGVLVHCEGIPLGGTELPRIAYRYRPQAGGDWVVVAGVGSTYAAIPLDPGEWDLQPTIVGSAAAGAIVQVTVG